MNRGSKVLVGVILFLVVLSVSATFYKTVILQDFEVTGVFIEFPTEESSYVWFVYDREEYELELETSSYDEILTAAAHEIGLPVTDLEPGFTDYLRTAYDEAEVTGTGEEAEEGSDEEVPVEEAESTEILEEEATSTINISEVDSEEDVIESEI